MKKDCKSLISSALIEEDSGEMQGEHYVLVFQEWLLRRWRLLSYKESDGKDEV